MRALVTGGAGFIGSHFTERALSGFYPEISSVIVLDKLTYAGKISNMNNFIDSSNFEFYQGDICDVQLVDKLMSKIDVLVNFAAESHVDRSIDNSENFVQTNILGTNVLLHSAKKHKIRKFIQVSTDEVYGSVVIGSSNENDLLMPNSPYSATKASADLLALSYFKTFDMNISITRCSNNYGPRQDVEKFIPNSITKILEGKKIPLYGDGLNVRDWLHVADHCDAINTVLTKGASGEIYNIGGGIDYKNLELLEIILEFFHLSLNQIQYVKDRPGHDRRYSVNYSKITKLGYTPKVNFRDGLLETINWYKTHFNSSH
jgi:dTDP-glucose 4,6-dehydratase